jgi:ferredoxin
VDAALHVNQQIIVKHDRNLQKNDCTGCGACRDICAKRAISFEPDSLDALHPIIDQARCVDCGMCSKVCPNNTAPVFHKPQKCYAAWSKNDESRRTSASGGIASDIYIEEKGICCRC